ncbi:hypothetical protein CVT24_001797 [Panaeolus cyanescens]|uniref:Uncharacterized protein n=1 Tax=Panaeolus cyanescens TaxID=181874 RepID=A0A409YFP0_9AGAR|nr:hypothetical protein CVT24_001797 [Panaeolus cyanescens]
MAYTYYYTPYYRASLSVLAIVLITLGVITAVSIILGIVGWIWIKRRRERAAAAAAEQQRALMAQTQAAYPYPGTPMTYPGAPMQQDTGMTGSTYYPQQAYPQNPQQGYPVTPAHPAQQPAY